MDLPVRHRSLVIAHQQPLVPQPALFAPEPPDVQEQHVPPAPIGLRLVVELDAAIARLAERPEGEGAVISQGAEDEGHCPRGRVTSCRCASTTYSSR